MTLIGENHRPVGALAISPDGRLLVSDAEDGKIHVWDVSTGRKLKTLAVEKEREAWRALAFSPDGSKLAAAGRQHGAILWDTATWTIRHEVPAEGPVGAEALAFAPDGRQVAVSMTFAAHTIDVATGKGKRRFPKQSIGMSAIAVSPDGATVATTGHSIKLWDIATGQEKTPGLTGHVGSVESVAFSPDGMTLATGSWDSTVKFWDVATRRERMTLEGHKYSVQSMAFSPDGKLLASIGSTPELILWDTATGKPIRTWAAQRALGQRVCFSPDGRWVAAETLGRDVGVWDVATGKQIRNVVGGADSFMFAPDGKKLILARDSGTAPGKRRLLVWDIEQKKADRTTEDGLLPTRMGIAALSPDGKIIALAGWDYDGDGIGKAIVVFWDLAADRPLFRLEQWADHLAFTPDGRTLLGVGRDGLAQVWDPRNGTRRETIQVCEAGEFAIRDLAIAPDSRHFATAMGNGTARIFRLSPPPERVEPREPLPVMAPRAEPPIDLWKQLIGNPAPEFREVKAWAGGSAVKIADLRGKFVLLHFWNTTSALQMSHLVGLHEKFADQGLVIIAVQPDWGIQTVKEWQAHANRQREWGDRALPFRMALDGGGETPIDESGAMAPGATYAAFGVQSGRHGQALQPVNLLIGPNGRVVMGIDSPWLLERELEARMGVKAKVPGSRE
jgi:WD40 repeat protein/peroxiredoxin